LSEEGEKVAIIIIDMPLHYLATVRRKVHTKVRKLFKQVIQALLGSSQPDIAYPRLLDDPDLKQGARARLAIARVAVDRLLEKYQPKKSFAPTVLIKAEETVSKLENVDFGWGRVTPLENIVITPGNHINLFKGSYLDNFTDLLLENLQLLENATKNEDR